MTLALDAGLSCTGLVLLRDWVPVVIRNLRPPKGHWRARASWIVEAVANIMEAECPLVLAVETGYVPHQGDSRPQLPPALAQAIGYQPRDTGKRNEGRAASALKTSGLRERLIALTEGTDCELVEVSPSEAQRALTGDGRPMGRKARKAVMVRAARMQFPDFRWTQDTADALGVAFGARHKAILEALREAQSLPPTVPSEPLIGRKRVRGPESPEGGVE